MRLFSVMGHTLSFGLIGCCRLTLELVSEAFRLIGTLFSTVWLFRLDMFIGAGAEFAEDKMINDWMLLVLLQWLLSLLLDCAIDNVGILLALASLVVLVII